MSKLTSWRLIVISLIFGISDRTVDAIINNYSIDSLAQILLGAILLLLVNQLYPYDY